MTRLEKKKQFIRKLAEFLGGPKQVEMSAKLSLNKQEAKDWAELRNTTPLFGYPTVEEAEKELMEFLG